MKKYTFLWAILVCVTVASTAVAADAVADPEVVAAYRLTASAGPFTTIVSPTTVVVTAPDRTLASSVAGRVALVRDRTTGEVVPSRVAYVRSGGDVTMHTMRAMDGTMVGDALAQPGGYAQFAVPTDGEVARTRIEVSFARAASVGGVQFSVASGTALPDGMGVVAMDNDGRETVLLATGGLDGKTAVTFPETTVRRMAITFVHRQPLRLTALAPVERTAAHDEAQILFLGYPQHVYDVYADPDRYVQEQIDYDIMPDLVADRAGALRLTPPFGANPSYVAADTDKDGIPDATDNCDTYENPGQADANGNGTGDVCDDDDQDGVVNSMDNCPLATNRAQEDVDGDGAGDACDNLESRFFARNGWVVGVVIVLVAAIVAGLLWRVVGLRKSGETA